jgi:hypothetical protein
MIPAAKETIGLETEITFTFRNQVFHAVVFFRVDAAPFKIFVLIKDGELMREFGEELTIYTDFKAARSWEDDPPQLTALRTIIFQAASTTDTFLHAKRKVTR